MIPWFFFLPTPITYPLPTPIFFVTYPKSSITYPNWIFLPTPKRRLPTPIGCFFTMFATPKCRLPTPSRLPTPITYPNRFFVPTPKCRLPTPIMKFHSLFKTKLVLLSYDLDVSALPGIVRCEERGEIE